MRKKFLQGAATLSMAAAVCIMSGLVTASAGTLDKNKVSIDYENQRVVVTLKDTPVDATADEVDATLLGKLIDQVIKPTGQLLTDAKSGATIDLVAAGQSVNFGQDAAYVVDGKRIAKVNITVAQKTPGTNTADVLETDGKTLKADVSTIEDADKAKLPTITVTAIATVTKADNTTATVTGTKDFTLSIGERSESLDKADKEIMFGVSTVKNNVVKTASWEVHDIGNKEKVEIDISSLNTQKDNYMQIKGDVSADPITIFIPKTDKTVKLKYNAAKSQLEKTKGESATAAYEYRTQYGDWKTFGTIEAGADLSLYQEKGATLYFRLDAAKDKMAVSSGELLDSLKDASGNDVVGYKVDALPGKEMKVAIAKKANGPKATADFVKQTVTIPAGTQYRVVDPTEATLPSGWTEAASKTVLSGDTLPEGLFKENAALEVKKKATDTKPESKIFRLEFPNAKEEIADASGKVDDSNGAILTDAAGKTVTFKMTKTGSGTRQKDVLEIENKTDDQYQVYIGAAVPADGKGVKAVKKDKTIKITSPTDKAAIWVRKTGDKKSLTWSTDYKQIGTVTIPVDTPDDPEGPTEEEIAAIKANLQKIADEFFQSNITISRPGSAPAVTYPMDVELTSQTITWGTATEYTLADNTKFSDITISVSTEDKSGEIAVNNNVLQFTDRPTASATFNVTINVANKDGISIDKAVSIYID